LRTGLNTLLALVLFSAPILAVMIGQPYNLPGMFGVYQLGNEPYLIERATQAGISSVVRQYRWEQIEPEQNLFRFKVIDDWYNEVLEPNGLAGMIILRTGQCWATDNAYDSTLGEPLHELASAPPLDYDDYYNMVYHLVDHLKGRINVFVIENDPVTKYSWYGTPEEFIQLTAVAREAARAANHRCTLIGNKLPAMGFGYLITRDLVEEGLIDEAVEFWNGYYSRRDESFQVSSPGQLMNWLDSDFGLWVVNFANTIMMRDQAENLDAMGFNYYLHYDYIEQVVGWMYDRMEENGYYRPLLDLEHGVKDEREILSDMTAAEELIKGYTIIQSLGIRQVSWYPFAIDSLSHNYEYLKPMYLLETGELLPPYYAMRTFAEHFDFYNYCSGRYGDDYSRYSFENIEKGHVDLDIVWADSLEITVAIPYPPGTNLALITSHTGELLDSIPNITDTLMISVDKSPRLIKWKNSGLWCQ